MLPKVSILIPAYNSEPYIRRCLDSAINQTYRDIEIICVDDASKDNTFSIMQEYAKKDKRIQVYKNKRNLGIPANRNFLINKAQGEYFFFLDSDDWMAKKACQHFVKASKGKEYDISVTRTRVVFSNHKHIKFNFFPTTFITKHMEPTNYVKRNIPLCWACFINRSFWISLKVRFNDYNCDQFEDMGLMPYVFLKAKRILGIRKCSYFYYRRKGSTSKFEDEEDLISMEQMVKQVDYLLSLFKNNGMLYQEKYRNAICAGLYAPYGFICFFKVPDDHKMQYLYAKIKIELMYIIEKKYGLKNFALTSSWWKNIVSFLCRISYRSQGHTPKNLSTSL